MILELREFDNFPVSLQLSADGADLNGFSAEQVAVESLTLELTMQHSDEEYFCSGEIAAESTLKCCRCLNLYTESLSARIDFIIRSGDSGLKGSDDGIIDDEDYVYFKGTDLRVEINEPVRQAIILALPMHPLCSDGCKGLCTNCGKNLNSGPCGCKIVKIDPRWDVLKTISDNR